MKTVATQENVVPWSQQRVVWAHRVPLPGLWFSRLSLSFSSSFSPFLKEEANTGTQSSEVSVHGLMVLSFLVRGEAEQGTRVLSLW